MASGGIFLKIIKYWTQNQNNLFVAQQQKTHTHVTKR